MSARHLMALDAPETPDEVAAALPLLSAALDGTGPALALVPRGLNPLRRSVLAAVAVTSPPAGVALVVPTSGTTGPPQLAMLGRDALVAAAQGSAARLGGPASAVLALPVGSVGGAMVLVRSVVAGHPPVVVDVSDGFTARAFVDAVDVVLRQPHDDLRVTSLVPVQLRRLLDAGRVPTAALLALDAVLLGGAAAPPDLLSRARDAGIEVVTTYGMTETCGGCVYDGVPLPGVEVRITDDHVELAGPVLFTGYLGDPEGTRRVLRDGWLRSHDRGRVVGGRLEVLGRSDDVVQSGGANVSLPAVEAVLAGMAGVDDAVALALPDEAWGARVVAVLASDRGWDLAEVRAEVSGALGRASAPRDLVVLPELPRLTSGKPDRQALRTLVARRRDDR